MYLELQCGDREGKWSEVLGLYLSQYLTVGPENWTQPRIHVPLPARSEKSKIHETDLEKIDSKGFPTQIWKYPEPIKIKVAKNGRDYFSYM